MTSTPEDVLHAHGKVIALRPERVQTFGKFRVQNAEDFEVSISRPYFIKGLLHPGELSVWYGEPGCGKTFLLQHLIHAVSQGRSVFGRRVHSCPVLFFEMEGSGFYRRLEAVRRTFGACDQFFFATQSVSLFDNDAAVADVISAIKMTKAKLVAIDTLSRAMAGGNENGSDDMPKFVAVLDRIRETTGAAVSIIHHEGKDKSRGARGHNSLKAAADVEVEVSKGENGDRQARVMKARDDADGQALAFRLKVVELGIDDDGDAVTTCTVEEIDAAPKSQPRPKLSDFQAMVLKDALNLLSDENHTEHATVPRKGMPGVTTVRRDSLRRMLQQNGRLESQRGETLTRRDVGKVRDTLAALERKGVLCSTDEWVWRP